jgi:ATP-dependent DNA helicase RecG
MNRKEIMRIFRDVDLVEQLGSGIPRILQSYGQESFYFSENFTRMSFPIDEEAKQKTEAVNEGLNEGLKTLYKVIVENGGIKVKAISIQLNNRPIKTIERQVKDLINNDLIERRGSKKTGGYWVVK